MTKTAKVLASALAMLSFFCVTFIADVQGSLAANPACSPSEATYGTYVTQTFTSTGTCDWVVPAGAGTVDVLIAAGGGGGGGGAFAGGGGAGGLVQKTDVTLTPGASMAVVIGAGGAGGTADISLNAPPANNGVNGADSSFNSLIAAGGGGGAGYHTNTTTDRSKAAGGAGGSGGGGSEGSLAGGSSTQLSYSGAGFGTAGGFSSGPRDQTGGGGGGAGGSGNNGSAAYGTGGAGKASTWRSGTAVTYASGGAGGNWSGTEAVAAPSNTGDGGKGASFNGTARVGGAGGSGIVIIRWSTVAPTPAPGTPGTPTVVAADGQAEVTVVAPSSGGTPTSYTVTATPGPITCTVTGATGSCTLMDLTNDTSYTVTVTATNAGGTSSSSAASASFTPAAAVTNPTATLTFGVPVGQPISGATASIAATGLQATASYTFVLRSTPQTLLSGNASGGAVNTQVTIPSGLEPGWHSLTFSSTGSNGLPFVTVMYFHISGQGVLLETSATEPAAAGNSLVETGLDAGTYLASAVIFIGAGFAMMMAQYGARRRRISR